MPRHKLNRARLTLRVSEPTPDRLGEIAIQLGYIYGYDGNTGDPIPAVGKMLDALAAGKLVLVKRRILRSQSKD